MAMLRKNKNGRRSCAVAGRCAARSCRRSSNSTINYRNTCTAQTVSTGVCTGAIAYQLGVLENKEADRGLVFSTILANPKADYALNAPAVILHAAGCYLIQYTIFLPEGAKIDTVFSLEVKNQTLLSSAVRAVRCESSEETTTYTGQALATVQADTEVRLISESVICIRDTGATAMATLCFTRIAS